MAYTSSRTVAQIIADAITFIQGQIPALSLLSGTVARDVVIESPAQEFELVWTELARIQAQQTLSDPTAFTTTEINALATALGLTPSPGVAATGTVTFRIANLNATSGTVDIPLGTTVSTSGGLSNSAVVTFTTSADVTFIGALANTYFNPATGYYELNAPIIASATGTTGNVAAGTITVLVSTISGANVSVTNYLPTSGGTAAETVASLLSRIQTLLSGTNVGTVNGTLSIVNQNTNVVDAIVVQPGDPNLTRNQYGNSADVVIIGETLSPVTDIDTFEPGVTTYVLNNQPVDAISDVGSIITGVSGGNAFNFIQGTHFTVNIDYDSLTRGTVNAQTSITFLGNPFPDPNTTFTINYYVNSLVPTLQAVINSDANKIVGSDVLIREAVEVVVRVSAYITVYPGYTKMDVVDAAVTNVANLIDSSTLNSDLSESAIVAAIQNTPGVSSVALTGPQAIVIETSTLGSAFAPVTAISLREIEYARVDSSVGAISIT